MSWRPRDWPQILEKIDKEHSLDRFRDKDLVEAGADAMHQADIEFIRLLHPGAYQQIKFSMNVEEWAAWTK